MFRATGELDPAIEARERAVATIWRRWLGALAAMVSLWLALSALADEAQVATIGVLSPRPKPETLKAWQPTADYLSGVIPERKFVIKALDLDEMAYAVAAGRLDFIITNPENYVALELHHGATRIATLVRKRGGATLKEFGGVIVVSAARTDLTTLEDLRGRRIGAVAHDAFGGYRMQEAELLQRGIGIDRESQVRFYGLPQDRIVEAVDRGEVDAGFVRTDLLESMAAEGKIRLDRFRVLNPQRVAGFPFLLSTRLYPEWPFAVMPNTPEELATRVTVALLGIPRGGEPTRPAAYYGWTVPSSYESVHDVLRLLKLPPYDAKGELSLIDILRRHLADVLGVLLGIVALLTGFLYRIASLNRELQAKNALVEAQAQDLRREVGDRERAEERLAGENVVLDLLARGASLAEVLPVALALCEKECAGVFAVCLRDTGDTAGMGTYSVTLSPALQELMEDRYLPDSLALTGHLEMTSPEVARLGEMMGMRVIGCEPVVIPTGVERGALVFYAAAEGTSLDLAAERLRGAGRLVGIAIEQRESHERLRLSASVFDNAVEGIMITNADNAIIEVNRAFTQLSGYGRSEVIGKNPRLLKSGRHGSKFYSDMWRSLARHGHWRGEVWNRHKDGSFYAEILQISTVKNDVGEVTHHVATISDITDLKQTQERLERLANFDPLTGLPNRTLLLDRLQQAIAGARRHKRLLGVCFLDLDGFKPINDTYGHKAGDIVLVELSRRLQACLRAGDTLARQGGDEFVLLLNDLASADELKPLVERVAAQIASPFQIENHLVDLTASIGITLFPNDNSDPDALLRHADQAMYQAKQAGRSRYHVFDAELDQDLQIQARYQDSIRTALDEQQLFLLYQPKVDLRTGKVVGFEALLRWLHPESGVLLPGSFLPLIEGSDLICDVGHWALAQAIRQIENWGKHGRDWTVSVNVAARQLLQPGFCERLALLLEEHPSVRPQQLEIEILETAVLGDLDVVCRIIDECHQLGVAFSLDDFGTGYSSLTYMRHLPVDTVKIDRSFVLEMLSDTGGLSIIEGIFSLARAFDRHVVAEGVETLEHGTALLRLGVTMAQGFGIGVPMTGDAAPAWAAHFRPPEDWSAWGRLEPDARDFPLLQAEIAHRGWIQRLSDAAYRRGLPPSREQIENPHCCGLGKWFDAVGFERYGHHPLYAELGREHSRVHDLGRRVMDLIDAGQNEQSQPLIDDLEQLRTKVVRLMMDLQLTRER